MRIMSNLEYSFIVSELQPLVGKHFDKIRKVPLGYRFRIGDVNLFVQPGIRLHRTVYIEETETEDKFVQKTNAELDNARLLSIRQINNDRIIGFSFDKGDLIFEMFGKGNCILVKDGKTVVAMKEESWSDREIKRGVEYKPPKPSTVASLSDALTDRYVIIALLKLPLGKEYAQEVLSRSGIDEKTPGNKLTDQQIESIEREMKKLTDEAKPVIFLKGSKPVEFGLTHFSSKKDFEKKETACLNEAADLFYWENKGIDRSSVEKLERRLSEQKERMEELEREETGLKAAGDYIYAHYDEIDKIISESRSAALDSLEQKLQSMKVKIEKVDKKNKSIELEV